MAAASPSMRALISRIGAHEKWARTTDRPAATAAARSAFDDRFLREAREQHGNLPLAELAALAASARKAYFSRLALKSAASRRAKRGAA